MQTESSAKFNIKPNKIARVNYRNCRFRTAGSFTQKKESKKEKTGSKYMICLFSHFGIYVYYDDFYFTICSLYSKKII